MWLTLLGVVGQEISYRNNSASLASLDTRNPNITLKDGSPLFVPGQSVLYRIAEVLGVESGGRLESEVRRRVGVGLTEYMEEGNG